MMVNNQSEPVEGLHDDKKKWEKYRRVLSKNHSRSFSAEKRESSKSQYRVTQRCSQLLAEEKIEKDDSSAD